MTYSSLCDFDNTPGSSTGQGCGSNPADSGELSSPLPGVAPGLVEHSEELTQENVKYSQPLPVKYFRNQHDVDIANMGVVRVGFWRRVGAATIDQLAIILVYGFIYVPMGLLLDIIVLNLGENRLVNSVTSICFLLSFVAILCLYHLYYWRRWQATPGKMLIGAIIVDARTLQKPTTGQFVGRFFSYIVSGHLTFDIGYLMVAGTQKRGLHDYMAKTMVVYKDTLYSTLKSK